MQYRELVDFEPVDSVIVLTEASDAAQAEKDVRTYVISERMADQLRDVLVPNIQFDESVDNRALLVVANYGTGKSHLMSLIAAIAENAGLVDQLSREELKEDFQKIAGRFKVIRAEIGATKMSLRDIICTELTRGLAGVGVKFDFPDAATVTNNKDSIADMMSAFDAEYPGQGLLFVLDELLDYLRRRKDTELIEDLQFLREIGEVTGTLRFRFIAGIQEAIFDNPRFANVASDVKRVRDRFTQLRIAREDVAYVVQERLLKKSAAQKEEIREHLQQFTPLYEGWAESLENYVDLFPVHPAYLRTFEQIKAVEKREVLKTLSAEIRSILDDEVPGDTPGLIAYDSYRQKLSDDPSARSVPEVREVLDKSDVLRGRMATAMATPSYRPVAERIIDGLTVHRLTTDDIYAPIGATTRELCDDLCLLPEGLPEQDAAFLEMTVATVLDEILRAVSGQFITQNPENGQYYLDVLKDVDYDQRIEERAASLDADKLDDAYFQALAEVLERRDSPYVSGYRIWEYELPWPDKKVTRFGYLFMGAPNERSTAQPPRDFYVYFLQPYDTPEFVDEEKPDEVFFRLAAPDGDFTDHLRHYAGARALANDTTAKHRKIYDDKSQDALKKLVGWLRKNMGSAIEVTYEGESTTLAEQLSKGLGSTSTLKDQVDSIAASALRPHFEARYPGYPAFQVQISRGNLEESVGQALNHLAGHRPTKASAAVLESLALLDVHGKLRTDGEWASAIQKAITDAGEKVLNRAELLDERDPGVPTWGTWHLEPAWLVVVAAALTQLGRLEIGLSSIQIDALTLDQLTKRSLSELEGFSYLAPPKVLPIVQLKRAVQMLGLPAGGVKDSGADEGLVTAILHAVADLQKRTFLATDALRDDIGLWGAAIFEKTDERTRRIEALDDLLGDLKARNTVGKMNRIEVDSSVLDDAEVGLAELDSIEDAVAARTKLSDVSEYLREASDVFGSDSELSSDADALRNDMLTLFRDGDPGDVGKVSALRSAADDLRRRFAEAAELALQHDTLDGAGDEKKRRILASQTYADLKLLATVTLLPAGAFGSIEAALLDLPVCKGWTRDDLKRSVVPHDCSYRPQTVAGPSAASQLSELESKLDALLENWGRTLIENLAAPELQSNLDLLPSDQADPVRALLDEQRLPSPFSDALVQGLNGVLKGFEVRRITESELWSALFPDDSPVTVEDLRNRFAALLAQLEQGAPTDTLRVVPTLDTEAADE